MLLLKRTALVALSWRFLMTRIRLAEDKTDRGRWGDNIREWTGLEFAKSQRAVENRQKWRKPVVKSYVVPQRSWQLRDR